MTEQDQRLQGPPAAGKTTPDGRAEMLWRNIMELPERSRGLLAIRNALIEERRLALRETLNAIDAVQNTAHDDWGPFYALDYAEEAVRDLVGRPEADAPKAPLVP